MIVKIEDGSNNTARDKEANNATLDPRKEMGKPCYLEYIEKLNPLSNNTEDNKQNQVKKSKEKDCFK